MRLVVPGVTLSRARLPDDPRLFLPESPEPPPAVQRLTMAEFDRFARSYDDDLQAGLSVTGEDKHFYSRERLLLLRRRLQALEIRVTAVMDFGCGTGSTTPLLHEAFEGARVFGVDVSTELLDVARAEHARTGVTFMTPEAWPPDLAVDLVYSSGVFHHINPAQRPDCGQSDRIRPWSVVVPPPHAQQAQEETAENRLIAEHGQRHARDDHPHRRRVVQAAEIPDAPLVERARAASTPPTSAVAAPRSRPRSSVRIAANRVDARGRAAAGLR